MDLMIDKQRTTYMRIALGMAGVFENDMKVETIWRIYKELEQKKGDLALRDVAKIESQVSQKYKRKTHKPKNKMIRNKIESAIAGKHPIADDGTESFNGSHLSLNDHKIKLKNYESHYPEKNL